MKFADVIGQEQLKAQLIQTAQQEKVSQAMLFLGGNGLGKLTLALAFAQYLNCEEQGETDSCGTCPSCIKASNLAHPDIFYTYPTITTKSIKKPIARDFIKEWREQIISNSYLTYEEWIGKLDNENKQGNITAAECDQIVRQHSLRHFEGKYKIQIIWGGEYLSKEGNKLLKIIEEPPERTIFLIIAEQQKQMLVTILSRTQIVKFNRLKAEELTAALVQNLDLESGSAEKIAQLSEGSWWRAKHIAQEDESDFFPFAKQWLSLIIRLSRKNNIDNVKELHAWVQEVNTLGRQNQKLLLQYMMYFIRECFALQNNLAVQLNEQEHKVAAHVANLINWDSLSELSQLINILHYHILRNANARIGFMSTTMKAKAILIKHN